MWVSTDHQCTETLLDLLYYEGKSGRLGPETRHLLDRHILECLACRRKVDQFEQNATESHLCQHYG